MPLKEYDVVVVGAGSSGQNVALKAAAAGKSVVMTEGRDYGGTCPLRGCDPKLVLHAAAEAVYRVDLLRGKGFTAAPAFSWPDLMAWKRSFTEPLPPKSRKKMEESGIVVHDAYASFEDAHTLCFGGDVRVKGKTIVLATGMKPAPLDIPGAELMLTSDAFLDMDDLPAEMIIVGGGYIGSETAHICQALGCTVTLIVAGPVALDKFDEDLAALLLASDRRRGMNFHLESKAVAVRQAGKRFEVDVEDQSGKRVTLTTDRIIHCAGRVPNLEELQLEKAGIDYDEKKGITVNAHLQTTLDHVYAIGDCADSGLPLTPVATYDAARLSEALFEGKSGKVDYYPIPTVAFCLPGIASVGMTAAEAKKSDRAIRVNFSDASDWFHPRHLNEPVFAYKVLIDEAEDVIVGAHLVGPGATELINLFYLAIRQRIPVAELSQLIFAYPTAASTLKSMIH